MQKISGTILLGALMLLLLFGRSSLKSQRGLRTSWFSLKFKNAIQKYGSFGDSDDVNVQAAE